MEQTRSIKIGLVGPCTSGKSLLKAGLSQLGLVAVHIAQEHSYVEDMWRKIADPDILIFLDVSYPVVLKRRKTTLQLRDYQVQQQRLQNARENADLYINTDTLSPSEILKKVLMYIKT